MIESPAEKERNNAPGCKGKYAPAPPQFQIGMTGPAIGPAAAPADPPARPDDAD